jgi:hypothetical protein
MYYRKVFFVLLILLLFACQKGKRNFTVSGEINGEPGRMVYLKEMTARELLTVDSSTIDDSGSFSLGGFTDMARFYVFNSSESDFIVLIIHPGDKIIIHGDAGNLYNTYDVQGSDDSKKVRDLSVELNKTRSG